MIDILFDDVVSGDKIDYKGAYENSCKAVDNLTKSLDEAKKEFFRSRDEVSNLYGLIDEKNARYEEAMKEIRGLNDILDRKDNELATAKRQRELDLIALKEQCSMIEQYEFGFRVVEAFLGAKILEDYE